MYNVELNNKILFHFAPMYQIASKAKSWRAQYVPDQISLVMRAKLPRLLAWNSNNQSGSFDLSDVKKLQQDSALKKCFARKISIYQSKSIRRVFPSYLHSHQTSYLFALWVLDLTARYRVNTVETEDVEEREDHLLQALVDWRYNANDESFQEKFLVQAKEIRQLLKKCDPTYGQFDHTWDDLLDLMQDHCKSEKKHWDPEVSCNELSFWGAPRKVRVVEHGEPCFLVEMTEECVSKAWQETLTLYKRGAVRAMTQALKDLRLAQAARDRLLENDVYQPEAALFQIDNGVLGRNAILFLEECLERIPKQIEILETLCLEGGDWKAGSQALNQLIRLSGDMVARPEHIMEVHPLDAATKEVARKKFKEIEKEFDIVFDDKYYFSVLDKWNKALYAAHRLVDTFVTAIPSYQLANLFFALRYYSRVKHVLNKLLQSC